jgi:Delta7-sterol 5-desaturase
MFDAFLRAVPFYPTILVEDLLRYVIGAGLVHLLVNIGIGQWLRRRRIHPDKTTGHQQIIAEVRASLRTVLIFSANGFAITIGAVAGALPIYLDIAERGWFWFATSVILLIVLHDAWFYWTHRLMHQPRLYRHLHHEHHRSYRPTAFAAYRFDVLEALVQAAYLPLALAIIPTHPLAIFLFTSHMILRDAMAHSGVELFPARKDGRPRLGWLTTVTHHDLHHGTARWNFGLYFTWWDRFCGTEHPEYLSRFAKSATRASATLICAVTIALAAEQTLAETAPLRGTWVTEGASLVIRFDACTDEPGSTCGIITHSWDPSIETGIQIIHDLRPTAVGWAGRLIDPETDARYKGRIEMLDPDTLRLEGCAGPICQRQIWRSARWFRAALAGAGS